MKLFLAALCVILFLCLIWALVKFFGTKRSYKNFVSDIDRKAAKEKEVAGRRRITMKTKQFVLERDGYTCQICGISKGFVDALCPGLGDYLLLEIDHITSVAEGGTGSDEENLQVLCWRCNRKKGKNKTNEQVAEIIDYGVNKLNVN